MATLEWSKAWDRYTDGAKIAQLCMVPLIPAFMCWRAFALMKLWGWFFASLFPLDFAHAFAAMLLVSFCTHYESGWHPKGTFDANDVITDYLVRSGLGPAIYLGIGAFVHHVSAP